MKNLGSAAVGDIGARLGGRAFHGNMPGRMADSLYLEIQHHGGRSQETRAARQGYRRRQSR